MSGRNKRRVRRGDDEEDEAKSVESYGRSLSREISEDGGSVASRSNNPTAENSGDESEGDTATQDIEFKAKEHIDNLSERSGAARESALNALKDTLSKNILSEFLVDRKETMMDALRRCFRKGGDKEKELATDVISLAIIQLGAEVEADFQDIRENLLQTLFDRTGATEGVRAAAARALGMGAFITDDVVPAIELMEKLAEVYGRKPATGPLPAAAIGSWALLLTRVPTSRLREIFRRQFKPLVSLLDSDSLDVRVNAGEALALLFEAARGEGHLEEDIEDAEGAGEEGDDEDEKESISNGNDLAVLCDRLQALATESSKRIGKKERAQQRSSFRDILYAVEKGQAPEETLKFQREKIVLDTWALIIQSSAIRDVLGEGMKTHFEGNELIRDIFGMGGVLSEDAAPGRKMSALEKRKYMSSNSDQSKARSRSRQKSRDKRMVV